MILASSYRSIKVDEEKKKFIEVEHLLLQKIEEVCHQKCKYKILINKISNKGKARYPIEKIKKICEEEKTSKGVWIRFISIERFRYVINFNTIVLAIYALFNSNQSMTITYDLGGDILNEFIVETKESKSCKKIY